MTNFHEVADWNPEENYWVGGDNLQNRYPHWQPIAAINQDRLYEFDIVAAFYDPQGECYYAARTRGCSCPNPWDECQTEIKGPLSTPREAVRAFRDLAKEGEKYDDGYPASAAIDAVGAILNHTTEKKE